MKALWLVAALAGSPPSLPSPEAVAEVAPQALPLCKPRDMAAELNNPDGDARRRVERLVAMESNATKLTPHEKFVVGVHYRNGAAHPARLVNRDIDKARQWLSHAAVGGHLYAMASLAELELAEGKAMDAMVWAQAYTMYSARDGEKGDRAYQADLLRRAFAQLPRGKETEDRIQALLDAFVDRYDAGIRRGLADPDSNRDREPSGTCRRIADAYDLRIVRSDPEVMKKSTRTTAGRSGLEDPGLAVFLVRVDPDGAVREVLVIESLPGPATARALLPTAMRVRFNPIDPEGPVRDAIMPFTFSDRSVRLRD